MKQRLDLSSWGRFPASTPAHVRVMRWSGAEPVWSPADAPMLAYGQGRSYGDVCLNNGGTLIRTDAMDMILHLDTVRGVVRVEAGCTFDALLQVLVPRGWFLPVVPGTRFVSVGGAIANDIHGKNHHRRGTFGRHVRRFELLRSSGDRVECSPSEHADVFAATIGGLGLTGCITWAEIQCMPITSTTMDAERIKVRSLDESIAVLTASNAHEYSVAWVDTTAPERQLGRGHVITADHARGDRTRTLRLDASSLVDVPVDAPSWLLRPWSMQIFNTVFHHRQRRNVASFHQPMASYFWPLDAVHRWNRLYGKRGMLQYQVVVPQDRADVVHTILATFRRSGIAAFLAVLKIFGDVPSPGLLSFPRPGLTLSVDLAHQGAMMLRVLDELDAQVVDAGGRVYPAKDARMSAETFRRSFPEVERLVPLIDPAFSSSFWRRVMEHS